MNRKPAHLRILILCTGNSCRSQMVEGFLKSFDRNIEVHSAGTFPASEINQKAVEVMAESGIDISRSLPKSVDEFLNDKWDYVITVCDDANETCPVFPGKVKNRIHIGFEDPGLIEGPDEFVKNEFRRIRDEIRKEFLTLYQNLISGSEK